MKKKEQELNENIMKFEGLLKKYHETWGNFKEAEFYLNLCTEKIIDRVIHEFTFDWNANGGRFLIWDWKVKMQKNVGATLFITKVRDSQCKITITSENFTDYDYSDKVKAFLRRFIKYFREHTNGIPIQTLPYIEEPN